MAMTADTKAGDMLSEMNTTPLIDVMLVLLTLLIITLPMQTNAVKIGLPHPGPPAPPVPVVTLAIDFDGSATWNGAAVDRATLGRDLANIAAQQPQPALHIEADRLARYDAVAAVMAQAQRDGLTQMTLVNLRQ
jgi:biopolymer transport protein ExbD